ncbi:hypothetical protein C7444_10735 [Sphaerotilus hippei]|uniref:Uncharacterized protein n=1 Tax=Sphaerotilus hippei TaxID=744406 RepID=A0A318H008_9BURK|nr:hypothetical protein [Sphaerotilus hippei]PXW96129.1 hypothetical protein C7444_10735 [Sphaerotilus hippei]
MSPSIESRRNGDGELLRMYVRCGLDTRDASVVCRYLQWGHEASAANPATQVSMQLRMLQTLLQTAHDTALPWHWRSTCLEHARCFLHPRHPLRELLGVHDPLALRAIEAAVQTCRDRLPRPGQPDRG